jgi:alcohol dehydrogenase
MRAARFYEAGRPLQIEDVQNPSLRSGGAIVKVLATHIPNFTKDVISGDLNYFFPPAPFTIGTSAVGIVESVADDVFGLEVGQKVFCDPHIYSRTIGAEPDGILIGWTGLAAESGRTQSLWKDGTFAEKALWPAEAIAPINLSTNYDDALLAATLSYPAIAYGGLLRGQLRPSQTVVVNGATGGLGAAAVWVALAMGAGKIAAIGRNADILSQIVQLDPNRVVSVVLSGNVQDDAALIKQAVGKVDLVADYLGSVTNPEPTLACIHALRPGGTAVFMGGVKADIPLPYAKIMIEELNICGAFMYPRYAPGDLLNLIEGKVLDLNVIKLEKYPLQQVNEAIVEAAKLRALGYCVLVPST